jgi:hypothetical protein
VGCDLSNGDRQAACWTALGKCLLEARRRIELSGIALLDDAELQREKAGRRRTSLADGGLISR